MVRFISILFTVVVLVGLVSAQTAKPATVKLAISGMSCNSCVTKVDKALRSIEGVQDVKVDLKNESAEIVLASASVKSDALVKAVVKAGFKAQVGGKTATMKAGKKESCCSEEEKDGACEGECEQEPKEKKKTSGKS